MHFLKQEQFLPISLEEAWVFFATPKNLNKITPKEMVFEITSDVPEKMYEGLVITYRIKPMLNLSMHWHSQITRIIEYQHFIDEQIKGPYRVWHHEHHFKKTNGGVIMTDIVYYDVGKWILGWLAGKLFVHRKVREIFDHRRKVLETYFSKTGNLQT